jgi:hypothetical protein
MVLRENMVMEEEDILKELTVFEDFNYSASDLPSAFLYKIGFPAKIDGESLRNIQERD